MALWLTVSAPIQNRKGASMRCWREKINLHDDRGVLGLGQKEALESWKIWVRYVTVCNGGIDAAHVPACSGRIFQESKMNSEPASGPALQAISLLRAVSFISLFATVIQSFPITIVFSCRNTISIRRSFRPWWTYSSDCGNWELYVGFVPECHPLGTSGIVILRIFTDLNIVAF